MYRYLPLCLVLLGCAKDSPSISVTSITIAPAQVTLAPGATQQLAIAFTPPNATNQTVSWTSSDGGVATVNGTGLITAVGTGAATIVATTAEGGKSSQCNVTVADPNQVTYNGANWKLHNPDVFSIKTNNGADLQLDLERNALWYNTSEGGQMYREVEGNFVLTAHVQSVKKSNNAQATECSVCLGGLMARNPAATSADEDYVHLVSGVTPGGHGAEMKSTTNSNSVYQPTGNNQLPFTDEQLSHDLKLQRTGSVFAFYKKSPADADWVLLGTEDRPDLPSTLAVGINIYTSVTGAGVADLSVKFHQITIAQ